MLIVGTSGGGRGYLMVCWTCCRDGQKMGSGCDNVEIGERVEFNVTVVLSRCPTSTHNTMYVCVCVFVHMCVHVL